MWMYLLLFYRKNPLHFSSATCWISVAWYPGYPQGHVERKYRSFCKIIYGILCICFPGGLRWKFLFRNINLLRRSLYFNRKRPNVFIHNTFDVSIFNLWTHKYELSCIFYIWDKWPFIHSVSIQLKNASRGSALQPELGLESTGESPGAGSLPMGPSWAEGIIRVWSRHVPW